MSKLKYVEIEKKSVTITCIISLVAFVLIVVALNNNIFAVISNKTLSFYCTLIGLVLAFGSFFVLFSTLGMLIVAFYLEREDNKAQNESFIRIKQKLSNDFSKISLKNFEGSYLSNFFTNTDFICEAKLDSDNNVIIKIKINAESTKKTNDYTLILNNFDI